MIDETHKINELEQEKIILEEINKHLSEDEKISNEIFDSMSHELRMPIVTIKGYTDMLLKGHFGQLTVEQREKLERVRTSTNLLIENILKLLDKKSKRD